MCPEGIGPLATTQASLLTRLPERRRWVATQIVRDWMIVASIVILVLVIVAALFPDLLAPFDPYKQSLRYRLAPPLAETPFGRHWLGTDSLGRDVFSRVIYGARYSIIVASLTVLTAGAVGLVLGLVSGFYGGVIDDVIGWLVYVYQSFPSILLAIAVAAVLGPGLRNLILVLTLTTWVVYARVVRGEVMAIRDREYIMAARVIGASDFHLLLRHVLPNILTPLIIITTFEIARIIIAEASLSFLGLGTSTRTIAWGSLMADARKDLATSWWIATAPGVAIMLTVLSVNLVGDWLRDHLDPRIARG